MFLIDFFDAGSDFYSLHLLIVVYHIYTLDQLRKAFIFSFDTRAHLACLAPVVLNIFRGLLRLKKLSFCVSLHTLTFVWRKEQRKDRDFFFIQSIKLRIDRYGTRAIDHYTLYMLDAFKFKCT